MWEEKRVFSTLNFTMVWCLCKACVGYVKYLTRRSEVSKQEQGHHLKGGRVRPWLHTWSETATIEATDCQCAFSETLTERKSVLKTLKSNMQIYRTMIGGTEQNNSLKFCGNFKETDHGLVPTKPVAQMLMNCAILSNITTKRQKQCLKY